MSDPQGVDEKEAMMLKRVEMDKHVTLFDQLAREVGPVILVNTFHVEPEEADALLEAGAARRTEAARGGGSVGNAGQRRGGWPE